MSNVTKTTTSTQIRNMYSQGKSYLNIKFFNTNLAFSFYPFTQMGANGRSQYDMKNGQITTVDYEKAFVLYRTANDILDGKIIEGSVNIPCNDATLVLERKMVNGKPETTFTIIKNHVSIPFVFAVYEQQVKSKDQVIMTNYVEGGLGVFMETLHGYLTGINADRHLDKLTEDFINAQNNPQQQNNNTNFNNGFKKNYGNNNYNKKPYQNQNYNYNNKNYNNQNNNNRPSWGNNTQSMSDFQINN